MTTSNVTVTQIQETAVTVTDGTGSTHVSISDNKNTLVRPNSSAITVNETATSTVTQIGVDETQVFIGHGDTTAIKFHQIVLATPEDSLPYDQLVDEDLVNSYVYIGKALPGTATSAPLWAIERIEFVSLPDGSEDVERRWADGVATYTHVWEDRATLSYVIS